MRYKNHIALVAGTLQKFKEKIDNLEAQYFTEKSQQEKEIEGMHGKYTPEYIENYKKSLKPSTVYKTTMEAARKEAQNTVSVCMRSLQREIDSFFNAPVKSDFANTINSVFISGVRLSDAEFQILEKSATNYLERKLLSHLAESRTKSEIKTVLNEQNGSPEFKNVSVSDAYEDISIPDIEAVYSGFKEFKNSAEFMLDAYSGKQAGLYEFLNNGIPNYMSVEAGSFLEKKNDDAFTKILDEANGIISRSDIKRELTQQDLELIDTLVDPRYPNLAKDTVKAIAKNSPELAELFDLDPRYSKFLED